MQPKIIENFISKNAALFIDNEMKKQSHYLEPDWSHPKGINRLGTNVAQGSILFDFINLIIESVSMVFNLQKSMIKHDRSSYTLMKNGQSLTKHHDVNIFKEKKVLSAVLYLNDQYEGGEFLFYNEDGTHKSYHPEAGTLIYFEGNEENQHEVLPVLNGERSNIVFFYITDK